MTDVYVTKYYDGINKRRPGAWPKLSAHLKDSCGGEGERVKYEDCELVYDVDGRVLWAYRDGEPFAAVCRQCASHLYARRRARTEASVREILNSPVSRTGLTLYSSAKADDERDKSGRGFRRVPLHADPHHVRSGPGGAKVKAVKHTNCAILEEFGGIIVKDAITGVRLGFLCPTCKSDVGAQWTARDEDGLELIRLKHLRGIQRPTVLRVVPEQAPAPSRPSQQDLPFEPLIDGPSLIREIMRIVGVTPEQVGAQASPPERHWFDKLVEEQDEQDVLQTPGGLTLSVFDRDPARVRPDARDEEVRVVLRACVHLSALLKKRAEHLKEAYPSVVKALLEAAS